MHNTTSIAASAQRCVGVASKPVTTCSQGSADCGKERPTRPPDVRRSELRDLGGAIGAARLVSTRLRQRGWGTIRM